MNVDHTQELTHLSLCTGYGGIDIGLSRALGGAVRSIAYVEIEAFPISNLVSKIEAGHLDAAPIFTDLKRFPWRRFHGRVDILSGGFPCQPFSSAGARRGDDDPRHLFPYILNGLRELGRPPLVFLENVEGIISSKLKGDGWSDPEGTPVLLHVIRELERVGYDATSGVFSAREIGAPHQRKRVFIMACRADLGESGRAIVSELLERGGGADMEHAPSSRLQGGAGQSIQGRGARLAGTGTAYPAPRGADVEHAPDPRLQGSGPTKRGARVLSESAESGTAYPAPRGAEQHPWEPPRVTVGDAQHNGLLYSEKRRGSYATSHDYSQRTDSTRKLEGASQSQSGGDIQTGIAVGDARSRVQESPELEFGLLQKPDREGKTSRPQRTNGTRRARANVTREAQPAMGRDPNGAPGGVDYAQLCRSVDNRTDELRLLGNGVVPDTAARAFRELWRDLIERG